MVPLSVGVEGLNPAGLGEVGYDPRLQMQIDGWEVIGYRAQNLAMFEGTETAGLLILKRQISPPKLESRYMAVTGGPHRVVVNTYETTGNGGSGVNLWEIAAEASNWTAGPDDSLGGRVSGGPRYKGCAIWQQGGRVAEVGVDHVLDGRPGMAAGEVRIGGSDRRWLWLP